MFRPLLVPLTLVLLALAPALALQAQPDHEDALVPFLKQGYREAQAMVHEDAHLGTVHAVLLEEGEGAARHRNVLCVFATRSGATKLIHQAEYAWATLERFADVDHDGKLDLVVRAGNGGNCWACGWVEAVSLGPDHADVLIPPERFQQLEDLDGDGTLEAIATDARWEFFEGLCHACSPRVERIFRRRKGEWVEASSEFPAYYQRSLEALTAQLERQARENTADWDEYQLGTLISILLNRTQLGERAPAWKAFTDRIAAWKKRLGPDEDEARARLDTIVSALQRELK